MKLPTVTLFWLVFSTAIEGIIVESSSVVDDASSPAPKTSGSVPVISHTNNDKWSLGDASNSSGGKDSLRGTIAKGTSSPGGRRGCGGCNSGNVKVVGDMWSLAVFGFGTISLVGLVM